MTFIKDLYLKKTTHSQPTSGNYVGQTSSTSYVDVSGSSFSFECSTSQGYEKVIFEVSIQTGWSPDAGNNEGDLKIVESTDQSSWSDIEKSKVRIEMQATYHDSTFEHKFILDPWSGTKYFKAQIKAVSSATEFKINQRGYTVYPWLSPPIINVRVI